MFDGLKQQTAPSFDARVDEARAAPAPAASDAKLSVQSVDFWYGEKHALKNVNLEIGRNQTTAFIGPSGCGKSTMLLCLNRMHDEGSTRLTGRILLDGENIYDRELDLPVLRRRFGWVAQKPNPFPWSVYQNIAYGPRIHGLVSRRSELDDHVEACLRRAGLWEELKDRLQEPGTDLSGGQQQRLCIARALSVQPEVLLMDEPCGSLDPISTETIEDLILQLSNSLTIVLITHNMEQAARVAANTAFFILGEMKEHRPTKELFANPHSEACASYLSGRFG